MGTEHTIKKKMEFKKLKWFPIINAGGDTTDFTIKNLTIIEDPYPIDKTDVSNPSNWKHVCAFKDINNVPVSTWKTADGLKEKRTRHDLQMWGTENKKINFPNHPDTDITDKNDCNHFLNSTTLHKFFNEFPYKGESVPPKLSENNKRY